MFSCRAVFLQQKHSETCFPSWRQKSIDAENNGVPQNCMGNIGETCTRQECFWKRVSSFCSALNKSRNEHQKLVFHKSLFGKSCVCNRIWLNFTDLLYKGYVLAFNWTSFYEIFFFLKTVTGNHDYDNTIYQNFIIPEVFIDRQQSLNWTSFYEIFFLKNSHRKPWLR